MYIIIRRIYNNMQVIDIYIYMLPFLNVYNRTSEYNIIDFKKGAQITGSRFPLYKVMGAQLQRALINFFLDYNTNVAEDWSML